MLSSMRCMAESSSEPAEAGAGMPESEAADSGFTDSQNGEDKNEDSQAE